MNTEILSNRTSEIVMKSIKPLLDSFLADQRNNICIEFEYYKNQSNDQELVKAATLSLRQNHQGRFVVHHHQRRIGRDRMANIYLRCMLDFLPNPAWDFEQLYAAVRDRLGSQWGIGPMTLYDISVRIGSKFNIWPEYVYLQCGSLHGARNLGFKGQGRLTRNDLRDIPELDPLMKLGMGLHPVEVFLCLYRNDFRVEE